MSNAYGVELILDLHGCDITTFSRKSLAAYFVKVCEAIDMKRERLVFWDDMGLPPKKCQSSPHTKGTSAVQFILTSSIVVHTLELLEAVYVNIFSCKTFDSIVAEKITRDWFAAKECRGTFLERE